MKGEFLISERFYIIWRTKKAGFFSMIAGFMGHIKIAIANGMTPVIDLENYVSLYQEKSTINGTKNVFGYYFKDIGNERLSRIYEEKCYVLSGGDYPNDFTMSVSSDPNLLEIWNKYFVLNDLTKKHVEQNLNDLNIDSKTLGIHLRGQEMRRARSHPMPMSVRQAKNAISNALKHGDFNKVFIVTEGANYLKHIEKAFPDLVVCTSSFRTYYINSYLTSFRREHYYKLGLEILTDMILLSKCGGFISASSNVSEMAILLNNCQYKINQQIRNGTNSKNLVLSKFYWYLKAVLPPQLGGFKKQL